MKRSTSKHRTRSAQNTVPNANQFRIIGGQWRGRKLKFEPISNLRPTADRTRETLFNWLTPYLAGARCVDLFTGSGALGIEALSRGAAEVTFVDAESTATDQIKQHMKLLECSRYQTSAQGALPWLQGKHPQPIDLAFLDPPFAHPELFDASLEYLASSELLAPGAIVYIEQASNRILPPPPSHWKMLRHKYAGQVQYGLLEAP